jgi:glycosyltransferase involved in cell wall biosynthesis
VTEIIAGEFVRNELSKNAMGGTELMALRMVRDIDPELLKNFQIIHSRVRELRPDLKKILVFHDLPNDPEVQKFANNTEYCDQFDKLVFVSDWQLQYYNLTLGIPYSKSIVIHNGVEEFPIRNKRDPLDKIRIIYHTTPHRGLEFLVPVFEELCKYHNDIELDIYSSFNIYGWGERDKQYQELFDRCTNNPRIINFGYKPNIVVRHALERADIFAYPSIWPETSCIAAIEALMAGVSVVCPNYAALPETCANFAHMYQWSEDKQEHATRFLHVLHNTINLIRDNPELDKEFQQIYHNKVHSWNVQKQRWEQLLKSLI